MAELERVADQEDRGVVADDVVVALGGVELQRPAARVAPGVWAAALTGHGGEPDHRLSGGAGRKHCRFGERADVIGDLEASKCAAALGMWLAFRDAFAVERRHLFDQVVIVQQDRSVGADGQRVLVTSDGDAGIGRGRRCGLRVGHSGAFRVGIGGSGSTGPVCPATHLIAQRLRQSPSAAARLGPATGPLHRACRGRVVGRRWMNRWRCPRSSPRYVRVWGRCMGVP
jgi:hypothetical protein